jgi:hypothetical protein
MFGIFAGIACVMSAAAGLFGGGRNSSRGQNDAAMAAIAERRRQQEIQRQAAIKVINLNRTRARETFNLQVKAIDIETDRLLSRQRMAFANRGFGPETGWFILAETENLGVDKRQKAQYVLNSNLEDLQMRESLANQYADAKLYELNIETQYQDALKFESMTRGVGDLFNQVGNLFSDNGRSPTALSGLIGNVGSTFVHTTSILGHLRS